jgi:hypothetical protein
MFIDEIDGRYPDRILAGVALSHIGFQVSFDLPDEHHLKVSINIYQLEGRQCFEVYETVQETSPSRLHRSEGDHFEVEGDASSLLVMRRDCLKRAIGDFDEHSYDDSFVGWLLEQGFSKGTVPEEGSDATTL